MSRIVETGVVTRCESGVVWVSTIQRSACASCQARHGCGQSSLQDWMSGANLLALPAPSDALQPGQPVELTIAANALAKAALLVYLLPLVGLMLALLLAHASGFGEGSSALLSLAGFGLGCSVVWRWSHALESDTQYVPRVENPGEQH